MNPKYSILLCNKQLSEYISKIDTWLKSGIKVIWFTKNSAEVLQLKNEYKPFVKAFLLMVYEIDFTDTAEIVDGKDKDGFVGKILVDGCPSFNSAQYMVEHCNSEEHVMVQASAGTGKTTVMIDRIMFLLHTQPNLHLSEVYMITFTNDATDQMNHRLQDVLMKRYYLTGKRRYLNWVEEQSQMNISTIHSFALNMLKIYGIGESFTKNLTVRTFQHEKNELIKDVLDSRIDENSSVSKQFGIPFYRTSALVGDFWKEFSKVGIAHHDVSSMKWGYPEDDASVPFYNLILDTVKELDKKYFDIKRANEAVSIDDIMRDLQKVLLDGNLPTPDITMKYLFIDEFQDSDFAQIRIACMMIQLLNPALFVVGDVKQSIYRFRGATDKSFEVLKHYMKNLGIKAPKEFTLVNNYRTSESIMNRMDEYFRLWGSMGMLQYDKPVIPFNKESGKIKMLAAAKKEHEEEQIVEIVNEELNRLIEKVEERGRGSTEKDRVVILTRSNRELEQLSRILRFNRIPAAVRKDGSFYASEAVRDFYMMVSSFMFCDEPKYIFNYLLTPYAGEIESLDLNVMEHLNGDYDNIVEYLDHFLNQTSWKKYHKDFRLRPVMSVFKDMLDSEPLIDRFIMNSKTRKREEGWEEARCNAATYTEARQYQANLEKLIEILQRNLGGDKISLYDVYNFLRLNIATNRSEGEAVVQFQDDYNSVLCMTVHKAKGLEFDTVIIPYTNRSFQGWTTTEMIIDPVSKRVGWNYTGDREKKGRKYVYPNMKNTYYEELKLEDNIEMAKEETRVLYVAMTRAINNLICIVPYPKNSKTWAHLLREGGIDDE